MTDFQEALKHLRQRVNVITRYPFDGNQLVIMYDDHRWLLNVLFKIQKDNLLPYTPKLVFFDSICIRGHFEECLYDENGVSIETIDMRPGGAVVNVSADQWHNLKSLESGTVLFAAKDGGYEAMGELLKSFICRN